MLLRLLIGSSLICGLEYSFNLAWLSFLEQTMTDAGLIFYDYKEYAPHSDSRLSGIWAVLFWGLLCLWGRHLAKPQALSTRQMIGLGCAVLTGMNLSALLKVTTTAQIVIQDALADPEGKGRVVPVEALDMLGWNLGGAASATLFAAAILGVRRMLREPQAEA